MIEKILERLEARKEHHKNMANDKTGVLSEIDKVSHLHFAECFKEAKEIVQEVAKEYGKDTNVRSNGWIPVEVELPPMPKENPLFENKPLELYLVTLKGQIYPFRAFWNGKFFTDGWGKVKATAWMELPAPYQKGE